MDKTIRGDKPAGYSDADFRRYWGEAETYADSMSSMNSQAFNTTSSKEDKKPRTVIKKGDYTYIGPYNLQSNGGKVTAEITTRENKKISTEQWSNSIGGELKTLNNLNYTGNNFYVVCKGDITSVESIKLTKVTNDKCINARVTYSESTKNDPNMQSISIYYGTESELQKELTLPGIKKGKLTIKKVDENNNRKILSGVSFTIQGPDGKYLTKNRFAYSKNR